MTWWDTCHTHFHHAPIYISPAQLGRKAALWVHRTEWPVEGWTTVCVPCVLYLLNRRLPAVGELKPLRPSGMS